MMPTEIYRMGAPSMRPADYPCLTQIQHLERETVLSMRKAHLLETFLVQNNLDELSMTNRQNALADRLFSMEKEILKFGLVKSARRYLGDDSFLQIPPKEHSHSPFIRAPEPPLPSREVVRGDRPREPHSSSSMAASSKRGSVDDDIIETAAKRPKLLEDGPCLRCKILKKKCDMLSNCIHCPQQGSDNENDYWKVLGCIRGPLKHISTIFCPDFARAPRRALRCQSGNIINVDFQLVRSIVSVGKKKRILQLMSHREDFYSLSDSAWSNVENRRLLSQFASVQQQQLGDLLKHERLSATEEYEAPWALIQAVSMDSIYGEATEYNPFTLLRLGNSYLKAGPASWDIYLRSKRILRQSVEIYLLERLCGHIASGDVTGSPPFDPAKLPLSNSLIMVDIKSEIEEFLTAFEKLCSCRARITGAPQLACFYALLVFSIAKSLLIDGYAVRSTCDDVNPWDEIYALQITSAFKALVSVFSWSSKSDIILLNDSNRGVEALASTRQMVAVDKWGERGFKSTRDFLLSLGSFVGKDYNGLFRQKFGIEKARIIPQINISTPVRAINQSNTIMENSTSTKTLQCIQTPNFSSHNLFIVSENDRLPESPDTLPAEDESSLSSLSSRNRCSSISAASESSNASENQHTQFTFVSYDQASKGPRIRSYGGRRGALDDATSKKVRDMRKIGACWNCWAMKVPCSEGDPCDRCKSKPGNEKYRICSRAPFTSQIPLFFPELLNSRFSPEVVETFVNQSVLRVSNQSIPVDITWLGQPDLKINATLYTPTPSSVAQKRYDGRYCNDLGVGSLPIGLFSQDATQGKLALINHVQSLLATPPLQQSLFWYRDSIPQSKATMQSLHTFYHSMPQKNALLHDALQFYLTLNMMRTAFTLTDSSAATINGKLGNSPSKTKFFSSRMLDRQIKQILSLHNREVLGRVLKNLEKVIRHRKASSWPIAFATILTLCQSIELLQTQAVSHTNTSGPDPEYSNKVLEEAKQICGSLEVSVFDQLSYLFHNIFRTAQSKERGGINPFRDSIDGLDDGTTNLVKAIKEVIDKYSALSLGTGVPSSPRKGSTWDFRASSGRLMFKFLASFNVKAAEE